MLSVFGAWLLYRGLQVSNDSSSSDMIPIVKCSLRGGITMLSSSPGISGTLASRVDVKPNRRARR